MLGLTYRPMCQVCNRICTLYPWCTFDPQFLPLHHNGTLTENIIPFPLFSFFLPFSEGVRRFTGPLDQRFLWYSLRPKDFSFFVHMVHAWLSIFFFLFSFPSSFLFILFNFLGAAKSEGTGRLCALLNPHMMHWTVSPVFILLSHSKLDQADHPSQKHPNPFAWVCN